MSIALSLASTVLSLALALQQQADGNAPAANAVPAEKRVVYIGGQVQRAGVFELQADRVLITDMLTAAGIKGDRDRLSVQLVRLTSQDKQYVATIPLALLFGDNPITVKVGPRDKIMVVESKE